jgi:protoporphyrinogen oxidase
VTSARALRTLAAAAALAAGCRKAAPSDDVAGAWVLERFGGERVPAIVPYQGGTFQMDSSTLTLGADGRYTLATHSAYGSSVSTQPPSRTVTSSGTYTRQGAAVRFAPSDGAAWTARLDSAGATLTTDIAPIGVYRRR